MNVIWFKCTRARYIHIQKREGKGKEIHRITRVDLGLDTQKQLDQVLAPLLGRDQQRPLPACGDGVGVGAGLEEALGVFVLAQLHLRKQGGLAGAGVLALECRVPGARDKTALTAVLWYGPRTINLLSIVTYPRRALSSRLPLRHARARRMLVTCS